MKPRFALRDLFWLVLVAGLALGWWIDRSRIERLRQAAEDAPSERLSVMHQQLEQDGYRVVSDKKAKGGIRIERPSN